MASLSMQRTWPCFSSGRVGGGLFVNVIHYDASTETSEKQASLPSGELGTGTGN